MKLSKAKLPTDWFMENLYSEQPISNRYTPSEEYTIRRKNQFTPYSQWTKPLFTDTLEVNLSKDSMGCHCAWLKVVSILTLYQSPNYSHYQTFKMLCLLPWKCYQRNGETLFLTLKVAIANLLENLIVVQNHLIFLML